jgi:TDG/mug DNA glycosylase family protein
MFQSDEPFLPDYLAPGLDVVFIGAAPSLHAARLGRYYAGSRNRFWLLLHQAGFTPRRLEPEEDHTILSHRIGLTGVMKHIASSANHELPPPSEADLAELRRKVLDAAPRVVCYNGKDVYRMVHGEEAPRWGLLTERFGESLQFVVHSTSGRADRWGADRLFLFQELKRLITTLSPP